MNLILLLFLIVFIAIDSTSISLGDDLGYAFTDTQLHKGDGNPITSLSDCLSTQASHYLTTNGRFIIHTLVHISVALIPEWCFILLNSSVFILCIIAITRLTGYTHLTWQVTTIAGCLILTTTPNPGLIMFSLKAFAINYLWSATAILWLLTGYQKINSISRRHFCILAICALICGSLQEAYSVPLLAAFVTVTVFGNKSRRTRRNIIFTICFLLGTLACVCAPGNFYRLSNETGDLISGIVKNFRLILEYSLYSSVFISVLSFIVIILLKSVNTKQVIHDNIIYILALVFSLLMDLLVLNGTRQFWPASVFAIILTVRFGKIIVKHKAFNKLNINVVSYLFLIITLIIYSGAFFLRLNTYKLHKEYISQIKNSKDLIIWGDVRKANYNCYPTLTSLLKRFAPDPWQRTGFYCSMDRITSDGLARIYLSDGKKLAGIYPLPPKYISDRYAGLDKSTECRVYNIDEIYSFLKTPMDFDFRLLRIKGVDEAIRPLTYTVFTDTVNNSLYIIFPRLKDSEEVVQLK